MMANMGAAMMFGMGVVGLLIFAVLVLGILVLLKYLRGRSSA